MSENEIKYLFKLVAIIQAFFVIGYTMVVFLYYLPKSHREARENTFLRWHVLTVSASYILLTVATVVSAIAGFYNWGNAWYWIVIIGYIMGDISLIQVFKHAAKKRESEKIKK